MDIACKYGGVRRSDGEHRNTAVDEVHASLRAAINDLGAAPDSTSALIAELADARQEIRSLRAALDGAIVEAASGRDEQYIRDRALETAIEQLAAVRAESARHALTAAARLDALTEAAKQRDAAGAEAMRLSGLVDAARKALGR